MNNFLSIWVLRQILSLKYMLCDQLSSKAKLYQVCKLLSIAWRMKNRNTYLKAKYSKLSNCFVFFHPTYWQEIGSMRKKNLLEIFGFTFINLLIQKLILWLEYIKSPVKPTLFAWQIIIFYLLQNVFENGPNWSKYSAIRKAWRRRIQRSTDHFGQRVLWYLNSFTQLHWKYQDRCQRTQARHTST